MEQYNFDISEGMELMFHERRRGPYGADMRENEETSLTHVCQTSLGYTRDELDTVDVDSLAEVFAEKRFFYQGTVSSDEGDISDPDDGSIEDNERNTWADWCDSAFWTAFSTFPSEADGPQPTVAFSDGLFSEEGLADMAASVHEEVPMLALRLFSDVGVVVIPPVVNRPVRQIINRMVGRDNRMDEVSVLSWPICDPPIHIGDEDADLSHGERVCLLYPAGVRRMNNGTVAIALDGQRLDQWRTVVWDPGIVGSQALSVCYDCLCLMALFRAVMSLVHDWAEWSVWTGTVSGYCRTITWEGGYLSRLRPPCDVNRLCD